MGEPDDRAAAQGAAEPSLARLLARGVCRALSDQGLATLTEFTLISGRRVDVIGLDRAGLVTIVEVKSSLTDFQSDRKWGGYVDYCDFFYFAVPEGFPQGVIPAGCGLMAADAFGAVVLRASPDFRLNATRRRNQNLKFGLVAAERLHRLTDPR